MAADPARLGGYAVRGRLGEGGQGVVYLGESATGELVAIKTLRRMPDAEAAAEFLREAEVLPSVVAFCSAQVIEVGSAGGLPYIVSEYVEGPTLQEAVQERGPLRGRELHRLAVGTVTALAAVHRAGVVHRDFKPGNVLLAHDGPRVIDFGIARATGQEPTGGFLVGTPSYMAPEQLGGVAMDPASDMFAWASTMVFAATGRSPFGQESLPVVFHRIRTAEPDLTALDGELRELVADCLAKDPADRPKARQVLLRLLGRPAEAQGGAAAEELRAGRAAATLSALRPTLRLHRRRGLVVGAAVVAALSVVVLLLRFPPTPDLATKGPLAAVSRTFTVADLGATLHEHPTDPLRLTSYLTWADGLVGGLAFAVGIREPSGEGFRQVRERIVPNVSPDGRRVAAVFEAQSAAGERAGALALSDRSWSEVEWVPVVRAPLGVRDPLWAADGRVLVTLTQLADSKTVGFAVVDSRTRAVSVIRTAAGDSGFVWGPEEKAVARQSSLYRLDGTLLRTLTGVNGSPAFDSGRVAALCSEEPRAACVLDAGTGRLLTRVPLEQGAVVWFWFGSDHLAVYARDRLVAVDLNGRAVRTLAEFTPGKQMTAQFSR